MNGLNLTLTEKQLFDEARRREMPLECLLEKASKHFESDTIEPITMIPDQIIEQLIEDDTKCLDERTT